MTSLPFAPIARRTITEDIRAAIVARVRSGDLPPGSALPSERELSEQFGVARTSVREAIQGLIMLGLIERRANRSFIVEHLPGITSEAAGGAPRRVQDLLEIRYIVGLPTARLATARAGHDDRQRILDLGATFDPDMPAADFWTADRDFHLAIARACGNDALAEFFGKALEAMFLTPASAALLDDGSSAPSIRLVIRGAAAANPMLAKAIADGDEASAAAAWELRYDTDQLLLGPIAPER